MNAKSAGVEIRIPDKYIGRRRMGLYNSNDRRNLRFARRLWRFMDNWRLVEGSMCGNGTEIGMRFYLCACDYGFDDDKRAMVIHQITGKCRMIGASRPREINMAREWTCSICDKIVPWKFEEGVAGPMLNLQPHTNMAGDPCTGGPDPLYK
jgi:hypothetical protein